MIISLLMPEAPYGVEAPLACAGRRLRELRQADPEHREDAAEDDQQ
jgi:hypothetical protein